jgi:hypothetical protein
MIEEIICDEIRNYVSYCKKRLATVCFWQTSRQVGSVFCKDFKVELDGVDGDGVSSGEVLSGTS